MIIGSGLIDYGRAALVEELLSAWPRHRNCENASVFNPSARFLGRARSASSFASDIRAGNNLTALSRQVAAEANQMSGLRMPGAKTFNRLSWAFALCL
jgi:hypothetical protein